MPATIDRPDQSDLKRVPDFFIVGHEKSGTSALYAMLRQHPQIFLSDVKEPSFFVPEVRVLTNKPSHPDTLDGYLALFSAAKPEQRIGDTTPSYLWSQTAAARIAEVRPDARIIAILREPASYLRSFHLQCLRGGVETEKDLGKAIALEQARREGKSIPRNSPRPQWLQYSEHVRYVEQLRRYETAFSREQMLVLIYEDYRADNVGTIGRLLRFLDIDESVSLEVIEANPSVEVRSPGLLALVRSMALGRSGGYRVLKPAIKALSTKRMRREVIAAQARAQQGSPAPPDKSLMCDLRNRYKREVVDLTEYLGRDLVSFWGYDNVA
jgi:hypothetical protein